MEISLNNNGIKLQKNPDSPILVEVSPLHSASLDFVEVDEEDFVNVDEDAAVDEDVEDLLEATNCGTIMQY